MALWLINESFRMIYLRMGKECSKVEVSNNSYPSGLGTRTLKIEIGGTFISPHSPPGWNRDIVNFCQLPTYI